MKQNQHCLILGFNPNKWFDKGSKKNCKVNKKLKELDDGSSWIGKFDHKNITIGMKGIIKVGHDDKRESYCKKFKRLSRGIYATFEVTKFNIEENRVYFKVIDNFFAQAEIISDNDAIKILTKEKFDLPRKSAGLITTVEYKKIREKFLDNLFQDKYTTKRKKTKKQSITVYHRDEKIRLYALEHANYQCELNNNHQSFISKKTNKKYMESHHLVPLSAYSTGEFEDTELDRVANIISLCPSCHRLIHNGKDENVHEKLSILFQARKKRLTNAGINISLVELQELYQLNTSDETSN